MKLVLRFLYFCGKGGEKLLFYYYYKRTIPKASVKCNNSNRSVSQYHAKCYQHSRTKSLFDIQSLFCNKFWCCKTTLKFPKLSHFLKYILLTLKQIGRCFPNLFGLLRLSQLYLNASLNSSVLLDVLYVIHCTNCE